MIFTLTLDRRNIDYELVQLECLMVADTQALNGQELADVESGLLRYYLYTALSQWLYHIYSGMATPPDTEFLVDEYLYGQRFSPTQRQKLIDAVQGAFTHLHFQIHPCVTPLIKQLEAYGEEMDDVYFDFNNVYSQQRAMVCVLVVETVPVDQGGIASFMTQWKGLVDKAWEGAYD